MEKRKRVNGASTPHAAGEKHVSTPAKKSPPAFPIVGIGASAGGLEALQELFARMPEHTGMAFIVVQHLDPSHTSIMPEILSKSTGIRVQAVKDRTLVKPDNIYVIPQNKNMAIQGGKLFLFEPVERYGARLPIDYFLRSLALDQKDRAICIILSGTGSDGTIGLREVKAEGGLCIVQEPGSAKYDGMPRHAIETGLADLVLKPADIPAQLVAYGKHFRIGGTKRKVEARVSEEQSTKYVDKILFLLRRYTRRDFTQYKRSTINRRIERRWTINQLPDIKAYTEFLERHPDEANALFKDILISVTGFFRDREAFAELKKHIRNMIAARNANFPLRVWIPGCATGEEAYSVQIAIQECLRDLNSTTELQIFATDLDADAIDFARRGRYPEGIAQDVSHEQLARFFTKSDSSYLVKREIRESIVFAVQDVVKDPPFSKLDLICCRNVMIYFNSDLQQRLVTLLHYSLNKDGLLFLGPSESVGKCADLFSTLNSHWRIFQRKEVASFNRHNAGYPLALKAMLSAETVEKAQIEAAPNIEDAVTKMLLQDYSPACAAVDSKYNVHFVLGRTGKYLELASGPIRLNIIDMANPGLRNELATLLRDAVTNDRESAKKGIDFKHNGGRLLVDITVKPLRYWKGKEKLYLVVFESRAAENAPGESKGEQPARKNRPILRLEEELKRVKHELQSAIEEQEVSNEELKSANEELQSTNEELQSTNEELETSREELQSVNEELVTLNAEHQSRIDELAKAADDLQNLLNSTEIATIFLDMGFNIRRYTPRAASLFNLIDSDLGRPISHLASNLGYDGLQKDMKEVLNDLIPKRTEIKSSENRYYSIRVQPYRTTSNVIDGIIINVADITEERRATEAASKRAHTMSEVIQSVLSTVKYPLVVIDNKYKVVMANPAFLQFFNVVAKDTVGVSLFNLGSGQWNIIELKALLDEILPGNSIITDYRVEYDFPGIGRKVMQLNARKVEMVPDSDSLIVMLFDEVTGKG